MIDQFLAKGSFRPLYNRDGTINTENCKLYCRPDQIAECAYSFEIAGTVTEEAAKESGLKAGTPVIVGTGDSTAEAISVGLVESGTVFFNMVHLCFTIIVSIIMLTIMCRQTETVR